MPEYARRVKLSVTIDGHDVTDYMAPSQLDFTYACNSGGKADEVRLTLHNRDGRWSGAWKPEKGMSVEAQILCRDWEEPGEDISLPCGSFAIDEIAFSGPPDKVEIKAVSADLTGGLRDTRKTRAWENTSLETVAGQIAGEYGLELFYSGAAHDFLRQDQRNEGDLAFLNRLAGQFGMSCKAHDRKLVLFDLEDAEGRPAAMTIAKTGGLYSPASYSFKDGSSGTGYARAEAAYTDPRTGTTHKARARALDRDGGKTLTLQSRAENPAQAARMARAALHDKNSEEETARVELMGCPRLVAGQTVALEGFGAFSATWFIKAATHRISGSGGYATSLELSRPCPTEEAGAYEEVCEAAVRNEASDEAGLNSEADKKAREGFEELLERLPDALQPVEELLLCLPEIAAAEAARTTDKADRQGWEYLEKMFYRWFGGEANEEALSNQTVFWVSLDWTLNYPRGEEAFKALCLPANLFTAKGKAQLAQILARDKKLTSVRKAFDYTNTAWTNWRADYFQQIQVPGMDAVEVDGLMVAMGNYTLRALAKGYVEPSHDYHVITVTDISIFLWDSFNFKGYYPLGYWNCYPPGFSLLPADSNSLLLENDNFNYFRDKYKNGEDFLVLSLPKKVDIWEPYSYAVQL